MFFSWKVSCRINVSERRVGSGGQGDRVHMDRLAASSAAERGSRQTVPQAQTVNRAFIGHSRNDWKWIDFKCKADADSKNTLVDIVFVFVFVAWLSRCNFFFLLADRSNYSVTFCWENWEWYSSASLFTYRSCLLMFTLHLNAVSNGTCTKDPSSATCQ